MPAVDFYHCTRTPLNDVAVRLAAKAHDSGQPLLIVGDSAQLAELDELLWTFDPASFLPHAIAGVLDDAAQPVLLADDARAVGNGATMLLLLAQPVPDVRRFQRIFNLFAADSIAQARADWRALSADADMACNYWQQTDSGWQRQGG